MIPIYLSEIQIYATGSLVCEKHELKCVVEWLFRKQGFEEEVFVIFFFDVEWPNWRLSGKLFRQVVQAALNLSGRNFRRNTFYFKKNSCKTISEPEMKIVGLPVKFFDMIVKTALCISSGSFWGECMVFKVWYSSFFADFEQKLFSPCGIFWQGRKNCIVRVRRNVLRNYVFLKKKEF